MIVNDYVSYKRLIICHIEQMPNKNSIIEELKKKYEICINSKRRIEYIMEPNDLIYILEKRGYLTVKKFEILEYINSILGNPIVNNILSNSKILQNNKMKKQLINEQIVKDIGKAYIDFGRWSGVSESELDCIREQYPGDITSRMWKLLTYIENNKKNDEEYFNFLCEVLVKSRRSDIKNKIKRVWETN